MSANAPSEGKLAAPAGSPCRLCGGVVHGEFAHPPCFRCGSYHTLRAADPNRGDDRVTCSECGCRYRAADFMIELGMRIGPRKGNYGHLVWELRSSSSSAGLTNTPWAIIQSGIPGRHEFSISRDCLYGHWWLSPGWLLQVNLAGSGYWFILGVHRTVSGARSRAAWFNQVYDYPGLNDAFYERRRIPKEFRVVRVRGLPPCGNCGAFEMFAPGCLKCGFRRCVLCDRWYVPPEGVRAKDEVCPNCPNSSEKRFGPEFGAVASSEESEQPDDSSPDESDEETRRDSRLDGILGREEAERRRAMRAEIVIAVDPIAEKWTGLRSSSRDRRDDWEDFSFYKANGRWAGGALHDLRTLDLENLATRAAIFDAAEKLLRERWWDPDYDEPTDAREEMLGAITKLRRKSARK